jgi:hypothetical protein
MIHGALQDLGRTTPDKLRYASLKSLILLPDKIGKPCPDNSSKKLSGDLRTQALKLLRLMVVAEADKLSGQLMFAKRRTTPPSFKRGCPPAVRRGKKKNCPGWAW